MRTSHFSLVLATLFIAPTSFAQPADSANSWTQEPTQFLGVPFQGDFKAQIPECPAKPLRPTSLCRLATADSEKFEIRGLPYIPISSGYQLFATVKGKEVDQLMLTGDASSLELVDDFLSDTLGQPGSSLSRRIQLSSGASYEIKTISWEGKQVAVHFQRNENDLSRYAVIFTAARAKPLSDPSS
ncbi:hypothetical protein ACK2SD_08025 [Pseudomonas sp. SC11]|uniref:hypothetical protein n=1 Tax=Pseudomonas sp. SC11 TaxID=326927 RepID=UPI00399AB408